MRDYKILFLLLSFLLLGLVSCDDTTDDNDYAAWREENIAFINSIAEIARANADGNWKVIPATGLDESKEHGNEYNVYCHVLQAGNGTEHPLYTDIVKVNYSGCLINGTIFDSTYDGELEPDFDVPVAMKLSGTVPGFYTSIQKMVAGDVWRVYIPADLAYGANAQSGIPVYSALIFDINLVSFGSANVQ